MFGVLVLASLLGVLVWMSINNYRDSKGLPKIHIHKYVPSWGNYNLEVCKQRNCTKWRLRG